MFTTAESMKSPAGYGLAGETGSSEKFRGGLNKQESNNACHESYSKQMPRTDVHKHPHVGDGKIKVMQEHDCMSAPKLDV